MTNEVRRTNVRRTSDSGRPKRSTEGKNHTDVPFCRRPYVTVLVQFGHRYLCCYTRAAAYTATIRDFAPVEGEDER